MSLLTWFNRITKNPYINVHGKNNFADVFQNLAKSVNKYVGIIKIIL